MGPPLFSDGDQITLPRKSLVCGLLQWGRRSSATETPADRAVSEFVRWRFNGAAALQRRRRRSQSRANSRENGFNGAAALQRRRRTDPRPNRPAHWHASMGPPLFSDGDSGSSRKKFASSRSFNGAAALQRRRRCGGHTLGSSIRTLQWGRRSSATETGVMTQIIIGADGLQWGRRSSATET